MVSRFLSVVRKEQRPANRLRVLGDDCIWGEEAPDQDDFLDAHGAECKTYDGTWRWEVAKICVREDQQRGMMF